MRDHPSARHDSTRAALAAVERGYQPIPLRTGLKSPAVAAWTRLRWSVDDLEDVARQFDEWADEGSGNVGLALGEASGGLIDIDLDHPRTVRLKDHFLPPTPMRSGRASWPNSHYWYRATGPVPGTRRYKMPDGSVSVELRSSGGQTVIPPSIWTDKDDPSHTEKVRWEGRTPWGGKAGPTEVDGRVLAVQVALLGLGTLLVDCWPEEGGRHDAYLALAGGLLRYGQGVHPWWEKNLPTLIGALADATHDNDGAETRVGEVMGTTLARLRAGEMAVGFPALAALVGEPHVKAIRKQAEEVESLAGFHRDAGLPADIAVVDSGSLEERASAAKSEAIERAEGARDPLAERVGTWQPVDLEPYLAGEVHVPEPEVLRREDGQALMYKGRVNMLYGSSESAKSWIALYASQQEMAEGGRVMYLDFEDEPVNTLSRLMLMGSGIDDLRQQFTYVRPDEPLAAMQRTRWGAMNVTAEGATNQALFDEAVGRIDPTLIVADGMTVLYGLHGLNSNDAVETEVITGWLKKLTRNGRSTVIIIDHTGKGPTKGSLPIGSQHKVAMVQGALLQVWPLRQPMPGALGKVELVVVKDRPGKVRAASSPTRGAEKAQVSAVVSIDSTVPGTTLLTLGVPPSVAPMVPGQATTPEIDLERERLAARYEEEQRVQGLVMGAFGGELDKALHPRTLYDLLPDEKPRAIDKALSALYQKSWFRIEEVKPPWYDLPREHGGNASQGRYAAAYVLQIGDADVLSSEERAGLNGSPDPAGDSGK